MNRTQKFPNCFGASQLKGEELGKNPFHHRGEESTEKSKIGDALDEGQNPHATKGRLHRAPAREFMERAYRTCPLSEENEQS